MVERAISENPFFQDGELEFEAHKGHVVLRGQVSTFYKKQMAQEALRNIDGITQIENAVEVL